MRPVRDRLRLLRPERDTRDTTATEVRPPKPPRRDKRGERHAKQVARRDKLSRLAARAATLATGRAYQRVGFASSGRRIAAYSSLTAVLFCVGYMSWNGEYNWATNVLLWTATQALMVPVALDVAAVACNLLALDQIDKGENGVAFRVLGAIFMGLGAWINWRYALRSGNVTEEVFFPAMSLLAYAMVHAVMGAARREARRRQHGHKSKERVEPLPRFGLLVWMPGLGRPATAMQALRDAVELRMRRSLAQAGLSDTDDADSDQDESSGDGDLTHLSQADAIRAAFSVVGDSVPDAVVYLASHGWPGVRPQRVHDIRRRDRVRLVKTQGATNPQAQAAP